MIRRDAELLHNKHAPGISHRTGRCLAVISVFEGGNLRPFFDTPKVETYFQPSLMLDCGHLRTDVLHVIPSEFRVFTREARNLELPSLPVAEDGGFEPPRAFTQHAFQACALGHYANPPGAHEDSGSGAVLANRGAVTSFTRARFVSRAHAGYSGRGPLVRRPLTGAPRAGRQQGQVGSGGCARGPSISVGRPELVGRSA